MVKIDQNQLQENRNIHIQAWLQKNRTYINPIGASFRQLFLHEKRGSKGPKFLDFSYDIISLTFTFKNPALIGLIFDGIKLFDPYFSFVIIFT